MVDDADLELNVLEFSGKSFSFERSVELDGTELAIFHRTETESESRFRPKVIRLRLVVPKAWVLFDAQAETLSLGRDGTSPGPPGTEAAVEAAAQRSRFEEAGIAWRRVAVPGGGYAYAPEEWADRLLTPAGLQRLGLG
jgi:hypothetical protein